MVTESGEAPPPADDGRRAETQEELEIMDGDDQIIVSDEHIIVQEDIIVQGEIMDPDVEAFVEEFMQEFDAICCFCLGVFIVGTLTDPYCVQTAYAIAKHSRRTK